MRHEGAKARTLDEAISRHIQEVCGRKATHVFSRGDLKPRSSCKARKRPCGQLGIGGGYREEIYVCDDHCRSYFLHSLWAMILPVTSGPPQGRAQGRRGAGLPSSS